MFEDSTADLQLNPEETPQHGSELWARAALALLLTCTSHLKASQAVNNGLSPCPLEDTEGSQQPRVAASSARADSTALFSRAVGPSL